MIDEGTRIEKRKNEHLAICVEEDVNFRQITTGFEHYYFKHLAMPNIDFSDISLSSRIFNKQVRAPFLISSMTGGSIESYNINKQLARAAENKGWILALGSMRAAIEHEHLVETFMIREQAPTAPVIANIGLVQLNYGLNLHKLKAALKTIEADALVFHLNPMQEVFQPEGDTNFKGLWDKLYEVQDIIDIPIGIKEVGMGLDLETVKRFCTYNLSFIDVAGAGGTSWIEVEAHRAVDPLIKAAAEAFTSWGIPTSTATREAKQVLGEGMKLITSGGIKNGVDAAKSIALGADFVGVGRNLLEAALQQNEEQLLMKMSQYEFELKAVMFGIGAVHLVDLQATNRLLQR